MKKKILLLILMLMPITVYASSGVNGIDNLMTAISYEIFVTIPMTLFVILPLGIVLSKDNYKKTVLKLFLLRLVLLVIFDMVAYGPTVLMDLTITAIGSFIVPPITIISLILKAVKQSPAIGTIQPTIKNNNVALKCTKCGTELRIEDKFCPNCGETFDGNNVEVSVKEYVNVSDYDPIFLNSEDKMIEEFLKKEIAKANIEASDGLIPEAILKRKSILNIIFALLVFVYISLIFFHFPIYTYLVGLLILLIFYKLTSKYDIMKYLKKEIKTRPNEKISNIVMSTKNSLVEDTQKITRKATILVALILPLIIFAKPRILYEKTEDGYAVRYYAFGLTNLKEATIPETYKGEKVVTLRGNAFSNMPLLEKVTLPDTIKEIRGQAFKNDIKLTTVNIPKNLEYLGGGAFYNCASIKEVEFPDTLKYIGGETFYKAKSLESVKLPNGLEEIRGDSFEYCTSLKSIKIPDSVTRIGGHAFYGDIALQEVSLTENSKLKEIGSSAFRQCTSLKTITLPKGVSINSRAFKESPTKINFFTSGVQNEQ